MKDGIQTDKLMVKEDDEQYQSPKVLAAATERLKALGGNPPPVPASELKETKELEEKEEKDLLTPDDEDDKEQEDVDADVENDEDKDDDVDSDDDSGTKDSKDVIVIPEQLKRAAEHSGWKSEEILNFWRSNPELAEKTFGKLHDNMVNVNTQFAEQGRAAKQLKAEKAVLEQTAVIQSQQESRPKDFVDIEKAREEFGDGAAAIIKQLNDALIQQIILKPKTADISQQEKTLASNERSIAAVQQLATWFASPGIKTFNDFYGDGKDSDGMTLLTTGHLTQDQINNRNNLIDMADDIEAGVGLRGGTISIAEALSRAHTVLTKDTRTKMIREEIMDKARKRSKGVTLRSSGKKIKAKVKLKPGEKKTETQLHQDTEKRLARLRAGKSLK